LLEAARPAARTAAEGLVDRLFELHLDVGAVEHALQTDESIDPELKSLAIDRARARGDPSPDELESIALSIAAGLCFLALACADDGRNAEAREALARAREAAGPATSPRMRQLLREAQARAR